MTADDQRLLRSLATMEGRVKSLEGKLRESGRAGKKSADDAFGSAAVGKVAAFAASFVGVQTAINLATKAMNDFIATRDEASRKFKESEFGIAQLAQLARSPQEFAGLKGTAQEFFVRGASPSIDQAARDVFSAKSAGLLGDKELLIRLASSGLVRDTSELSVGLATLEKTFGRAETGGPRAIVSKALAASAISPSKVDELIVAASASGGLASELGISDEESLANVALLSAATGSAAEGGTQLRALLKGLIEPNDPKAVEAIIKKQSQFEELSSAEEAALARPDFAGIIRDRGLAGAVEALDSLVKSGIAPGDLIGNRIEGISAFNALKRPENKALIGQTLQEIRDAQINDEVASRLAILDEDARVSLSRENRISSARLDVATEPLGTSATLAETVLSELEIGHRRQGFGDFEVAILKGFDRASRFLRGDRDFVENAVTVNAGRTLQPDQLQRVGDQLELLNQTLSNNSQATESNTNETRRQTTGAALLGPGEDK